MLETILKEIYQCKNEELATHHLRFFKTGKGEYGEGDLFLGLKVPQVRAIVKEFYKDTNIMVIEKMLHDKYHEIRLCGLLILVEQYKRTKDDFQKDEIVKFYLENTKYINNWDLVDLTASYILGDYYYKKNNDDKLFELANSGMLWNERISIVATHYFIKNKKYDTTLKLCEKFLSHKHDLMHKACGWMLREVGKKDLDKLRKFLDQNSKKMPRTMLRYSIEKLSDSERKHYMEK